MKPDDPDFFPMLAALYLYQQGDSTLLDRLLGITRRPGRRTAAYNLGPALCRAISHAYYMELGRIRAAGKTKRPRLTPSERAADAVIRHPLFDRLKLTRSTVLRAKTRATRSK